MSEPEIIITLSTGAGQQEIAHIKLNDVCIDDTLTGWSDDTAEAETTPAECSDDTAEAEPTPSMLQFNYTWQRAQRFTCSCESTCVDIIRTLSNEFGNLEESAWNDLSITEGYPFQVDLATLCDQMEDWWYEAHKQTRYHVWLRDLSPSEETAIERQLRHFPEEQPNMVYNVSTALDVICNTCIDKQALKRWKKLREIFRHIFFEDE